MARLLSPTSNLAPNSERPSRPSVTPSPSSSRRLLPAIPGTAVTEALTKGTNMLHVRAFLTAKRGPNAWKELLASFPDHEREAFGGVVSVGWYPYAQDVVILRRTDEMFGDGDLRLVREIGAFSADLDLNGIQRMFLRLANPAMILEKCRDYWSRFHNTGLWTVTRRSPTAATASLRGWGWPDEAMCTHLSAYIVRMFECVGVKRVRFDHATCRCRGDDICVFEGEWR